MYTQRNQSSGTLLTQAFHPHSAEDQFSQEIQEQLNSSHIVQRIQMADNNGFSFQAFENHSTMLGSSLPTDWTQNYGDDMSEFVFSNGGVFVDGLISPNYVNDPSWVLAQTEQQSLHHVGQQQEIHATENSVSQNNDHVHLRAQTPGPLQKTNIPNYLTIRRRSLSADNIHALAKAQASHVNNHSSQNTSGNTSPNSQNTRSHLSRTSSASPINHAQRLNELQARFKVKLDKRTQRSMPNIQLTAAAQSAMPLSQVKPNTSTGTPIMDLLSVSTPNTPTFPPEKSKMNAPRRGHMRKRSLSAPTAPFQSQNAAQMPGSIPMQPAQSFPLNFSLSSSFRRNALPIQIQRNPKHNHNSPPLSSEEYQRKLDEELEKVDFDDITVSELKEMLRQRGKPATGKKAILMQRLQEEIMSSPTSPSGVSLQSRIANLHISSPPIHSRRFSPYGSVSIPGSPRMMPSGLGNGRPQSGFNGGNLSFPENAEEWQFQNVGLVQGNMSQPLLPHNLDDASIMIMGQHSHDIYGSQQPSSAPPTTTEFDAVATSEFQGFQQPSSAPPMTTEFVETYDFMNPMTMNVMSINPDMMRLSVSDVDDSNILLKQEPGNENKISLANLNVENRPQSGSIVSASSNDTVDGMLVQQGLGFDFNPQHHLQDENMMIKSEDNLDFLNYTTTNMTSISHQSAQHLPMQLELPQDGMTFGGW
ncbi:6268_t:CDS:2 [Funneliformis geosporum]|nr:6268_t:CDS:2 [Funneliformis geosporum]